MFGMMEAILSFLRRQVGLRTDAVDASGSLHAKVRSLKLPDFVSLMNDGADGAFSPSSNTTLPSGIYRFTSVNIPAGVTVAPSGSYLIILCTGDIVINGLLSASGKGAAGAPTNTRYTTGSGPDGQNGTSGTNGVYIPGSGGGGGGVYANGYGFAGGSGGNTDFPGGSGGSTSGGAGNAGSGSTRLTRLPSELRALMSLAGAGGGSGAVVNNTAANYYLYGGAGGAGGGVILLYGGSISGTGAIRADGINGSPGSSTQPTYVYAAGGGGGGGGGTIIVISPSINIATKSAAGGTGGSGARNGTGTVAGSGGNGGPGVVVEVTI